MTEDQAKKKWCPFVRELGDGDVAYNRAYNGKPLGRCVASECMAWRVAQIGQVLPGDEYKTYKAEGYCGLAGQPQ